jgi:hydroxymethylpyrimidine pyrophosphatase-like HAD family hydrolase
MHENYVDIDRRVQNFNDTDPQALIQIPERYWGRRPPARSLHGYNPYYTPEEQGLPNFTEALIGQGLFSFPTYKHPKTAYLFDVDGVLTDLKKKRVIHPEIIDRIAGILKQGEPVALNTGRSVAWLDRVIADLTLHFSDNKKPLENLVAVGEFGGTWGIFDTKGNMHKGKVNSISVPSELSVNVKGIIKKKFSNSMMFDETKETMVSIEMIDGFDLDVFHDEQKMLTDELNTLLADMGYSRTYDIHTDQIATNIMSPHVGKDLGASRFLEFLREKEYLPQEFIAFGDSISDLEMGKELKRRNFTVQFFYVGHHEDLEKAHINEETEDVHFIGNFTQGTLDILAGIHTP